MTIPTSKLNQRMQKKKLNSLFQLPDDEEKVDDWSAALHRNILLQGRLYLFRNYVCFYSKLFGDDSLEVVKLSDVIVMTKKRNGIEIIVQCGERLFFASFLARNKTFTALVQAWKSAHAGTGDDETSHTIASEDEDEKEEIVDLCDMSEKVEKEEEKKEERKEAAAAVAAEEPMDKKDEDENTECTEGLYDGNLVYLWQPPAESSIHHQESVRMCETYHDHFDQVDLLQFFHLFYSENSNEFAENAHKELDEHDLVSEPWKLNEDGGKRRLLRFNSVLHGIPVGPPSTRMTELQWYSLSLDTLVVETVQNSLDVPYGDFFDVENRWEFARSLQGGVDVTVKAGVYFKKKTWLKSQVETTTLKKCKECHKAWCDAIKNYMSYHMDQLGKRLVPVEPKDKRNNSSGNDASQSAGASDSKGDSGKSMRHRRRKHQSKHRSHGHGIHHHRSHSVESTSSSTSSSSSTSTSSSLDDPSAKAACPSAAAPAVVSSRSLWERIARVNKNENGTPQQTTASESTFSSQHCVMMAVWLLTVMYLLARILALERDIQRLSDPHHNGGDDHTV